MLASEAVAASLTLLPVLVEKKRGLVTLGGFTGSLILLLMTCAIFTGGDWLGITLISVIFGLSAVFLPFVLHGLELPNPLGNHKALLYMSTNTILLFGLLLTAAIYSNGDWFLTIACPIASFWLIDRRLSRSDKRDVLRLQKFY